MADRMQKFLVRVDQDLDLIGKLASRMSGAATLDDEYIARLAKGDAAVVECLEIIADEARFCDVRILYLVTELRLEARRLAAARSTTAEGGA